MLTTVIRCYKSSTFSAVFVSKEFYCLVIFFFTENFYFSFVQFWTD